jgi:sugar/nucleoside kinase (ribokinase family)
VPAESAPGSTPRSAAVLACGLATLDVVQTVDAVPTANQKVVADDLLVTAGGPAANAAVTCAALGVPSRLLTRIGDGPLAAAVHADLAAHGVDVLDVAAVGSTPPVSTVLVTRDTGERAVVSVNGTLARAAGDVPDRAWDGVVVVLVDGHHLDLAVAFATDARRRGIPVLLDGGSWKPGLEALVELVDVAVLSADFAVPGGSGDLLDDVRRLGPGLVAQSHGAAPIEALVRGRRFTVPVPAVDVVDTLGAGDVLHGALVARVAARAGGVPPSGDGEAWLGALAWAARVASASCGARGARGWIAAATELTRWPAELTARQTRLT